MQLLLESGVTGMAVAGSRNSETEGYLLSAEGRGRQKCKGTDETVAVGRGVTWMTAAVSGSRSSDMEGDIQVPTWRVIAPYVKWEVIQRIWKKSRDLWARSKRRCRNEEQQQG